MTNLAPLSSLMSSGIPTLASATSDNGAVQFDEILNQQLANPAETAQTDSKTTIAVTESKTQTLKPDSSQTTKMPVQQPNQLKNLPEQSAAIDNPVIEAPESQKSTELAVANVLKDLKTANTETEKPLNIAVDSTTKPANSVDLFELIANIKSPFTPNTNTTDSAEETVIQSAQTTPDNTVIALINASLLQSNTAQAHVSDETVTQEQETTQTSVLTARLDKAAKTLENTATIINNPSNLEPAAQLLTQTSPLPAPEARLQASANMIAASKESMSQADSKQGNSKAADSKAPDGNPVMSNQANKPAIETLVPPVTELSHAQNLDRNGVESLINNTEQQAHVINSLDTAPVVNAAFPANAEVTPFTNNSKQILAQYPINTHYQQAGWSQEIGNRLVWMANQDIQSAQLTVNPENLGSIQIQIQIDANKVANILFFSPQAEVRQALENSMGSLSQLFNESGISLGQTNVGSQASQQQFQQQTRLNYSGQEDLIEPPALANTPIQGNGLINTTA